MDSKNNQKRGETMQKNVKSMLRLLVFFSIWILSACQKNEASLIPENQIAQIKQEAVGYGLTVAETEKIEAEQDCKKILDCISELYQAADYGDAINVVLDDTTILEMQNKVKALGVPVYTSIPYCNMENYEIVDRFLLDALAGKSSTVTIYEIQPDGAVGRIKYLFSGTDMYEISTRGVWKEDGTTGISTISRTKIQNWQYTDKGWFCYTLYVPQPPEVSEIVDGSYAIRIQPMTEENRTMSERCVLGLGYQGNNILCSNWDINHMEVLDFNGIYEYLYNMQYHTTFQTDDIGIPAEDFENLITAYFPITKEQIREYAVFDASTDTYAWERLGCFNYAPTFFGTSLPEVTEITQLENGIVVLTVDAVCDMVICDDAVITHKLTVQFHEDGSFQYLGNEILDGFDQIPKYQYRMDNTMHSVDI